MSWLLQGKADLKPSWGIPASEAGGDVGVPVYLDLQNASDKIPPTEAKLPQRGRGRGQGHTQLVNGLRAA